MSKEVLRFDRVSFCYKKNELMIAGLDFAVQEGTFNSIVGVSGSGKSTLFKLITGLEHPNEGKILLNGKPTHKRLGRVGYMPQQDLLMPWRTVLDNAILPLEINGVAKKEASEHVYQLLEAFGLTGVEMLYPSQLSGGMRQRVSFLRTVLSGSNLLLLDEPFSALDAITKRTMQTWLLDQWESAQKTVIFITHDVEEALFLSDHVYVITETPITELEKIDVPLNRPRSHDQLRAGDVVNLKESMLDRLQKKVMR